MRLGTYESFPHNPTPKRNWKKGKWKRAVKFNSQSEGFNLVEEGKTKEESNTKNYLMGQRGSFAIGGRKKGTQQKITKEIHQRYKI